MLICTGAVLYPRDEPNLLDIEEKSDFDKFSIVYSLFIAFLTLAFITLTVYVTCCCQSQLVKQSQSIRNLKSEPLSKSVDKLIESRKVESHSRKSLLIIQDKAPSLTKK